MRKVVLEFGDRSEWVSPPSWIRSCTYRSHPPFLPGPEAGTRVPSRANLCSCRREGTANNPIRTGSAVGHAHFIESVWCLNKYKFKAEFIGTVSGISAISQNINITSVSVRDLKREFQTKAPRPHSSIFSFPGKHSPASSSPKPLSQSWLYSQLMEG